VILKGEREGEAWGNLNPYVVEKHLRVLRFPRSDLKPKVTDI
jgi:hypothetical protein